MVDAIPILLATWPGVRFFVSRLILIKSPTVFTLDSNALTRFYFFIFNALFKETVRCARPSRATDPCVHPTSADSFLFAAAMTASVLVSVSKTEFSPCGSHGGSPK